ncbi:MAG: T9SS type A sorting domain-containing protein [Bacteroidetes bacterium]|nr:T9SS type A sorting domain-containing protein [Bacteroidota bacterium]
MSQSHCGAIQNAVYENETHAPFNKISYFSKIASNGNEKDGYDKNWQTMPGDNKKQILYNGLDWMLVYNFYRIERIKANTATITEYKNAYCPCKSSFGFYADREKNGKHAYFSSAPITALPYTVNQAGYQNIGEFNINKNDYKDYGIFLADYLTHNFSIGNLRVLKPKGDLTICGSTTTVEDGGRLSTEVNTNTTYPKILKVGKNGILEIKSGGTLNIENNTKVVIEEGAKLILHTGAIVNLNGLNALLEINEGQIVMAPGANVTINAGGTNKGFIRVINNWTTNDKPTIVALDANCKLTIAGPLVDFASCFNKKILEVQGNIGFVTDWDLKQLDIKNGFIAMDKGARITSNAAYYTTFTTVNIDNLDNTNNNNKHNGIYIPSKNNKFTDVTISNAETGITFYNKGEQNYLNLDNVRIGNKTSIGIMQVGGGFAIKNNCSFNCTGINIKTVGNSFNSTFFNSKTTGSIWPGTNPQVTGIPMDYHGKGYLYSYKGGFGQSMNMALQVKDAHLRLRCSELNNSAINLNYMNARYIQLNGNAYNLFLWPVKTHIKGYGTTNFQLNNGKNYFDKKVFNPAELHFDIKLKLLGSNTPNPNTSSLATLVMPAYGNYFNIDNSNILAQGAMVAKPNAGFNYSIFKTANNISNYIELQIDPPTYKNGSFLPDMDESCVNERHQLTSTVVGGGGAQMRERYNGDFGQQSKSIPPPPQNISPVKTSEQGGVITYKPMHKAVSDNYHRINTGNALGLDSAIKELIYIVSHNNDNTNLILRNEDIEDMQYLYTLMNDAYTFVAIGADSIVIAEQTQMQRVQPYVNNLNMAFQQVWTSATTDSSSVWQDIKYHVATDWAQIHRLANNRPEALNVLNNTEIEISNPIENIGLNKWKCINQMEMAMMQDSTLTLDSALNLYTCIREEPNTAYLDMLQNLEEMWNGGSGNEPFQIQNINKLAKLAEQKQFALYPNPANNALTISVNKQIIQSIMVYDMHGKLLITQEPNAINLCQININALPEGIYNVVVKTNATVYNQKITVVHN